MQHQFQIIGHRGARGLYPENTFRGFIEALNMGVDALELDVVVSKDRLLVVSHEAWMNPDFCTAPAGLEIKGTDAGKYNLYQMSYAEIAAFDCGMKRNPGFPLQETMPARKPLLSELITTTEAAWKTRGRSAPRYHIELKTEKDHVFNPPPAEFVSLLLAELKRHGLGERLTVKSFDIRILQELRKKAPAIKIALLVETTGDVEANLRQLGFTPGMYCPDYTLVSAGTVREAKKHGMLVVPWTVNASADFQKMVEAGVDGIITDYPNKALEWRQQQNP